MEISSSLQNRLKSFDNVSITYVDDFPMIIDVIDYHINREYIKINNPKLPDKNAAMLFRKIHSEYTMYQYIQLFGKITENKFIVNDISGWDTDEHHFDGYIQKSIPEGSSYLSEFNWNLFDKTISEMKEGLLISSVNGVIKTRELHFSEKDGLLSFRILKSMSIYHQLKVNPVVKIQINTTDDFITKNIMLEGKMMELDSEYFVFKPNKMEYGTQTELETLVISPSLNISSELLGVVKTKYNYWKEIIRVPILLATIFPVIIGNSLAYSINNSINLFIGFLTLIGLLLVQLGINFLSDYFDHKSKNDEFKLKPSPLSGGRYIHFGLAPPGKILVNGLTMILIAAFIGFYLNSLMNNLFILILAVIGGLLAYSYTGKPLQLSYRGLGEISILIVFGPIPVIASYYLQTNSFDGIFIALLLGISPGIYSSYIVFTNNLIDHEADERSEKKTLVVLLGKKHSITILKLMILFSQLYLLPFIFLKILPISLFIILLSTPFLIRFYNEVASLKDEDKIFNNLIFVYSLSCILVIIALLFS